MTGTVDIVMRLLLLSVIRTDVKGDGLKFAERGYDITFPCGDLVCFYMWQISTSKTSEYIAIVTNGEIQTAISEDKKCTLQIKDLTAEDVGNNHCQQRTNVSSPRYITSELNLVPGKTVSLQCVFLTYVEQGHCYTQQQQQISLTWVDEAGAVIQEDFQHQMKQQSSCNITLTVSLQRTEKKKFRCQATVAEQVQTSEALTVGAPGLKGKGRGRGFIIEPAHQGGSQYVMGAVVGVMSCVVLTAVVAVFVVNKRRTNSQLPNEFCAVQSSDNITGTNVINTEVIYADIILPVGSDRVWIQECETTEYACVRYK